MRLTSALGRVADCGLRMLARGGNLRVEGETSVRSLEGVEGIITDPEKLAAQHGHQGDRVIRVSHRAKAGVQEGQLVHVIQSGAARDLMRDAELLERSAVSRHVLG